MGGSTMPSIPVPIGVTQEVEKKFDWSQSFKLNHNDPHHGVHSMSMANSIVIAINERAMIQKRKLRQLRSGKEKVGGDFNIRGRQRPSPIIGRSVIGRMLYETMDRHGCVAFAMEVS